MAERRGRIGSLDKPEGPIEEHRRQALESLAAERRRHLAAAHEAMLERAGILERYRRAGFEEYRCTEAEQQRVFTICRGYAECFDQARAVGANLLLRGAPGTGKTHLASAILGYVLAHGRTGLYTTLSEALRHIRSAYDRTDLTEAEAIRRFTVPDLLVLDEVQGTIGRAETRQSLLFDVLDRRYAALKPTIVISNGSFEEIRDFLGPRLYDRLTEQGSVLLECNWASRRQQA